MTAPRPEPEAPPSGLGERFVKWIPLVVPLAALVLITIVAIIEIEVL
jgi:hypothetical protein